MAFQSVPETAEIVIKYTGSGSNMVNVFAARRIGGYTLQQLQDLADGIDTEVGLEWLPLQTEDVDYVSTTVRGLENENDLEAVSTSNAGPGEVIEPGNAGNVTFAVKKASGLTGRSARGRLYWIGLVQSNLATNLNQLDTAPAAAIVDAVDEMRLRIGTEGWAPVIISRFKDGVKRDTGETFNWNSSESVNIDVDSQRRRLLS